MAAYPLKKGLCIAAANAVTVMVSQIQVEFVIFLLTTLRVGIVIFEKIHHQLKIFPAVFSHIFKQVVSYNIIKL